MVTEVNLHPYIKDQPAVARLCEVLHKGPPLPPHTQPRMPSVPLSPHDFKRAHAAFKGIKVQLTHFQGQRRSKQVCELSTHAPPGIG